jgi:hypothetical protein
LLLKNVMEAYFGDPMYGGNKDMAGWTMIGYPSVRADYLEWVGEAKVGAGRQARRRRAAKLAQKRYGDKLETSGTVMRQVELGAAE